MPAAGKDLVARHHDLERDQEDDDQFQPQRSGDLFGRHTIDGRLLLIHDHLGRAGDAEVKATLRATTEEAVARGAYGAPTMFVGTEMFFGQDRLEFVREALG